MSSCMASSFSQGDAFMSSKPERTTTFTSSPPSRREEVAEGDAGQPVDADVNFLGCFLAAGDVEIAPARRAAADKHRIEIFREQRLHAVDASAADELDAEIEDVAAFLVD